jgi:hypothetical protein
MKNKYPKSLYDKLKRDFKNGDSEDFMTPPYLHKILNEEGRMMEI